MFLEESLIVLFFFSFLLLLLLLSSFFFFFFFFFFTFYFFFNFFFLTLNLLFYLVLASIYSHILVWIGCRTNASTLSVYEFSSVSSLIWPLGLILCTDFVSLEV